MYIIPIYIYQNHKDTISCLYVFILYTYFFETGSLVLYSRLIKKCLKYLL